MNKLIQKPSFLVLSAFTFLIWYHNVEKRIKSDDIDYINIYLKEIEQIESVTSLSYKEQIELIESVQSNVIDISPVGKGIPINQERRPQNLYEYGKGLCFDRSYVLEIIYGYLGFKTRHVSLYEDNPNRNTWSELTTQDTNSHAISEVKTKKGWIIVDSNYKWLGLDINHQPISAKMIKKNISKIKWAKMPPTFFYTDKHHFIYGLYSRHGKFYPPYNKIPDFNFREILYNL